METAASKFAKYIFVCENERAGEACCMPEGLKIRETLKELVKSRGLASKIRVSRAGCLDLCADGPSVVIMPDNIRLMRVSEADAEKILELALKGVA